MVRYGSQSRWVLAGRFLWVEGGVFLGSSVSSFLVSSGLLLFVMVGVASSIGWITFSRKSVKKQFSATYGLSSFFNFQ